ncbi:MAG: rod shape-determining protein MreC [Candidatus Acidiferrales bacterium]
MIDFPSRQRPIYLLGTVVLLQVLLLAFQIKGDHDVRLIRVWSVELLTPLQRAGNWIFGEFRGGWRGYVDLRHARQENQRLQEDLDRLELRNRELESRAVEADRLAKLLDFRESNRDVPMLAAQVIGANADSMTRSIYINRGEHDGLRKNMGVITPEGVVGKLVEVYRTTAQVLLLTDKDSGAGALLATSRTHGVAKGTGDPTLVMDYVVNDENVSNGEQVLTSGEDRIFPKDLPIGTVISSKSGGTFKVIRLQPAARLDRLEEVLVLLTQKELAPKPGSASDAGVSLPPANVPANPAVGNPSTQSAKTPVNSAPVQTPAKPTDNSSPNPAVKPPPQ